MSCYQGQYLKRIMLKLINFETEEKVGYYVNIKSLKHLFNDLY